MIRPIVVLVAVCVLLGAVSSTALAERNNDPPVPIDNTLPDDNHDGILDCPANPPAIGWQWVLVPVCIVDTVGDPGLIDRNGDGCICEARPDEIKLPFL